LGPPKGMEISVGVGGRVAGKAAEVESTGKVVVADVGDCTAEGTRTQNRIALFVPFEKSAEKEKHSPRVRRRDPEVVWKV